MRFDERIRNLVSEFKLDDIYPSFGKQKTVENWQSTQFSQFSTVYFCQKWGQMLSNFTSETRFGIPSSRRIF